MSNIAFMTSNGETDALSFCNILVGESEEICQHLLTMFRRNRFGMKLHAMDHIIVVADAHDDTICSCRCDCETRW